MNQLLGYIPFEDYKAIDALNQSVIKFGAKSLRHLRRRELGLIGLPAEGDKPKNVAIGNVVDDWLLEKKDLSEIVAWFPGKIRAGEKWEVFKAENPGKLCLLESWRSEVEDIIDGCARALIENHEASDIIRASQRQVSGLVIPEGTETQCKFRIDCLLEGKDRFYVWDVKTTNDASAYIYGTVAHRLGYVMQIACYGNWYAQLTGKRFGGGGLITFDLTDFDCVIDDMLLPDLECAYDKARRIIQRREACLKTNEWPGMEKRRILHTPNWAMDDEEMVTI